MDVDSYKLTVMTTRHLYFAIEKYLSLEPGVRCRLPRGTVETDLFVQQ